MYGCLLEETTSVNLRENGAASDSFKQSCTYDKRCWSHDGSIGLPSKTERHNSSTHLTWHCIFPPTCAPGFKMQGLINVEEWHVAGTTQLSPPRHDM